MVTGRPPLPTAIKEANGNPGHRPLNANEPKPDVGIPEPPQVVKDNPIALAYWNVTGAQLFNVKVITPIDAGSFTSLCLAYARAIRAEEEAAGKPLVFATAQGNQQNNNLIGIANTAWKAFNRIASEFGLTPSSRSRLVVKEAGEGEPEFEGPPQ